MSVCDLQGNQPRSLYLDKKVQVEGLVSVILLDNDQPGFFLQTDCADQRSSSGIFVKLKEQQNILKPGDYLRVEGVVCELDGETALRTTIEQIDILKIEEDIPEALDLTSLFYLDPFNFNYEDWEGVYITLSKGQILSLGKHNQGIIICPLLSKSDVDEWDCPLGLPFHLAIKGSLGHRGIHSLQLGDQLVNITGILRQDSSGYYLHVFDPIGMRLKKPFYPVTVLSDQPVQEEMDYQEVSMTPTKEEILSTTMATAIKTPTPTPINAPTTKPSPTWYPVPLLISEILPNPKGKEPGLEWIELYNPNSSGILLTDIKLGDAISPDGKEGTLKFPDGWVIEGEEVLVIANQGVDFFAWYGFYPDFELYASTSKVPELLPYPDWAGSKISLNNSGDEVLLLDPWDEIIDQVAYGNSTWDLFSPPVDAPGEGISLERFPADQDRDIKEDWRKNPDGSPGSVEDNMPKNSPTFPATPSPPTTVIASKTATITPMPSLPYTLSPFPTITLTLIISPTITTFPSPSPSLTCTSVITPTPTIWLSSTLSPSPSAFPTTPSPTVFSTSTPTPVPSSSHSWTPSPSSFPTASPTPNHTTTATIETTITPSLTPIITPTPSITAAASSRILINEIHADPHPELGDANRDGEVHSDDDEFIELVNIGEADRDLSGWKIQDAVKTRFTFPENVMLKSGCGLVVFGGDSSLEEIEGSKVFSAGSLGLNNGGDIVYLYDQDDELYLYTDYGPEGGQDQSLTRFPDMVGDGPLILHSEILSANGSLFSPGTKVDGKSFGYCP